jgi:hypothetical protein
MFVPKLDCLGTNLFFVRVNRFWCVWIRVLDFVDALSVHEVWSGSLHRVV